MSVAFSERFIPATRRVHLSIERLLVIEVVACQDGKFLNLVELVGPIGDSNSNANLIVVACARYLANQRSHELSSFRMATYKTR